MTTAAKTTGLNYTQKKRIKSAARVLCVVLVTLLFVSPLYISFIYALKTPDEMGTSSPLALPNRLYIGNFVDVITKNDLFRTGFINSLICTVCIVAVLSVITPMAAYAISRYENKLVKFVYLKLPTPFGVMNLEKSIL